MQVPSIGKTVLFAEPKHGHRRNKEGDLVVIEGEPSIWPAVVTMVNKSGTVHLTVFKTHTVIHRMDVMGSEQIKAGCYSLLPSEETPAPEVVTTPSSEEDEIAVLEARLAALKAAKRS